MKKIAIVLFVVAAALAGCGKKKAPAAPAGGDTAGSATEAGSAAGSDAGSAAPAEGGGSAM
jgi:uncharacterized membrane protein